MTREELLATAKSTVLGHREEDYNSPSVSFGKIAKMWSVILDKEVTPVEVALCMAALKLVRLSYNQEHIDSFVDLAGYAACGVEVATVINKEKTQ